MSYLCYPHRDLAAHLLKGERLMYRGGSDGGRFHIQAGVEGAGEAESAHAVLRACGLGDDEITPLLLWEEHELKGGNEWWVFRLPTTGLRHLARRVIAVEPRPYDELVVDAVERLQAWIDAPACYSEDIMRERAHEWPSRATPAARLIGETEL